MTEPTWREIRDLTRLRRQQAATVVYSITHQAKQRIASYDRNPATHSHGLSAGERLWLIWHFQCGHCYICNKVFAFDRLATREHVQPKALGGTNDFNILLACVPCNNIKANRPPTRRERRLLHMFNTEDRHMFHILLMTNPPIPTRERKRSKRRIKQDLTYAHIRRS